MKPIRALRSVLFSFICLAVLTAGLRAADSTATADNKAPSRGSLISAPTNAFPVK
jgi:hypothetical protein